MDQPTVTAPQGAFQQIVVSYEMTILRGRGPYTAVTAPENAFALIYGFGALNSRASLVLAGTDQVQALLAREDRGVGIVLLLAPSVVGRIAGRMVPEPAVHSAWHLPSELRAIALALRDSERTGEAGDIYLTAKGIELLYETWALVDAEALTPLAPESGLSRADSERIVRVRELIDERWNEKLSLEGLAALCGLNREKLTRGFREMFACSVTEAIAERRLSQASRMLLTTDLPVSSIGYENGYMNNASFSRAFGRRFGVSPSDFRSRQLAA